MINHRSKIGFDIRQYDFTFSLLSYMRWRCISMMEDIDINSNETSKSK